MESAEITVGARFAAERLRLGLGVQEAADACGITRNAINKIERGAMPSGGVLQGFLKAGADVGYVLAGVRCKQIDIQKLGTCEAAIRLAYEEVRGGRSAGAIRARMSALVYNQLAGKLKETDDIAAQAKKAAQLLVESLDDPADPEMIERNLFVRLPAAEAQPDRKLEAGLSVTGHGNRVVGRDLIVGQKRPPKA